MKTIALILLLATSVILDAQVAINTDGSNPDPSAILDLKSNVKGFLVPRLSRQERDNIQQPANGLLIYQVDDAAGFYYNSGTSLNPVWTLLSSPSTGTLWLRTGADYLSTSAPSDSVGIGRNQPVEKLNVNGNLALDNFQPVIVFREDTLESARVSHMSSQQAGYLHLQAWDGNRFETTGLVVKSPAQNVGVGTLYPAYKLDVAGTAHMNGFILSSATTTGYVLTSDENGNGTWQPAASHMVSSGSSGYLSKFATADSLVSSTVYQDSAGNVGIGTKTPLTKLDVSGKLNMRDNIGLNGNWISGDGSGKGIFVSNDGKVGIGTSSPASSLTSSGMIQAMSGGLKFPDNSVQTTAAASSTSFEPRDAAERRMMVALQIPGYIGPLVLDECTECSKVLDLTWYLTRSFDSLTGLPGNSSPQHHRLSVYKDIDGMSVPLIMAMVNHMILQNVYLKFYIYESHQQYQLYYTITLEHAWIVDFQHNVRFVGSEQFAHMDYISFTYESIGWNYAGTPNSQFETDWNTNPGAR